MSLADDIREAARNTLTSLDSCHDYFTYSNRLWALLERVVNEGRKIDYRNPATRSRVTGPKLVELSDDFIEIYLDSAFFQNIVTLFEDFFFDLLRLWLTAFPGSLSRKQVEFGTILKAGDFDSVTRLIIDREINEIKYDRLSNWFEYLERLVRLGVPGAATIEQLAEMKAGRDILVHNRGIVNAAYMQKAGSGARHQAGERLELPVAYLRDAWQTIKKVVEDMAASAVAKAPFPPN